MIQLHFKNKKLTHQNLKKEEKDLSAIFLNSLKKRALIINPENTFIMWENIISQIYSEVIEFKFKLKPLPERYSTIEYLIQKTYEQMIKLRKETQRKKD